ncbi:MAG: TrkH family potassium uptake protein [Anaerolineales bacterium]
MSKLPKKHSESRYQQYLKARYRTLLSYTGGVLMLIGGSILLPLVALLFYPSELHQAPGFMLAGGAMIGTGYVLWRWRPDKGPPASLTLQEGMVIIVLAWGISIVAGAVPFMLAAGLSPTQAFFESTSAWTSTGLTVVNTEEVSRVVLVYRSITQYVGGAGFAIIVLSAIQGPTGVGLSTAEGRDEQLAPNVRDSAMLVMRIYAGYAVLGIVAYLLVGMNAFDAFNHALTAVATGGFSTRNESIAFYDSAAIEIVSILLMILGSINFLAIYLLLRRRVRSFVMNGEIQFFAALLPLFALVVFLGTALETYDALDKQIRVAVFEVASALTTAGFTSTTYVGWTAVGWLALTVCMIIGGGIGSTAGGIKQFRVLFLLRAVVWELQRAFLPPHAVNEPHIWRGDHKIFLTDRRVRLTGVFIFLYLVTWLVGGGIIAAHGHGLERSLFEFSSALGTAGLTSGITNPEAPASVLWTLNVGMLLGRLEFFAFIIGVLTLGRDLRIIFFGDMHLNV